MRLAMTYRSERRNDWRKLKGVTWQEHNEQRDGVWGKGSMQSNAVTMRSKAIGRSRYMPHQGKREMARRSGNIDLGVLSKDAA